MITAKNLTAAGAFTKLHGIKGELHAVLDIDPDYFDSHDCFVCDMEGIFTPFFVESSRAKGSSATLIKVAGVDSDRDAKLFVGKSIFVDKQQYRAWAEEAADGADDADDAQGGYASDFIGWKVVVEGADPAEPLGEIVDIDDSTANLLFIVQGAENQIYIPVAGIEVIAIDHERTTLHVELPEGLIDLN